MAGVGVETYAIVGGVVQMTLRLKNKRYLEQMQTVLAIFEGARIENLS